MNAVDRKKLSDLGFELKESSTKKGVLAGLSHFELTESMISGLEQAEGIEELLFYASKVCDEKLVRAARIPGITKIGLLACRGYSDHCKKILEKSVQVSEFK